MQRLNGDARATWVQGHLPQGDELIAGDELLEDPTAEGMFGFENGVTVYAMNSPRSSEYEAICERGVLTAQNNGVQFRQRQVHEYDVASRTIRDLGDGTFPEYEQASSTQRLIEDLVAALDRGDPETRGGVRVARANMELIFGFVESHRRGGARGCRCRWPIRGFGSFGTRARRGSRATRRKRRRVGRPTPWLSLGRLFCHRAHREHGVPPYGPPVATGGRGLRPAPQ